MMESGGCPVRLASLAEMPTVRGIRNRAFSGDGHDAEDDGYDVRPNCRSYVLCEGTGEPIGTLRVSVYSAAFGWLPIPAFDLFADELKAMAPGLVIVQSSLFAISADERGLDLVPKLLLIREVLRAAFEFRADLVVTIVKNQGSQIRFYHRM